MPSYLVGLLRGMGLALAVTSPVTHWYLLLSGLSLLTLAVLVDKEAPDTGR